MCLRSDALDSSLCCSTASAPPSSPPPPTAAAPDFPDLDIFSSASSVLPTIDSNLSCCTPRRSVIDFILSSCNCFCSASDCASFNFCTIASSSSLELNSIPEPAIVSLAFASCILSLAAAARPSISPLSGVFCAASLRNGSKNALPGIASARLVSGPMRVSWKVSASPVLALSVRLSKNCTLFVCVVYLSTEPFNPAILVLRLIFSLLSFLDSRLLTSVSCANFAVVCCRVAIDYYLFLFI